jgi:AcrR family transcriptional regulator
MKRAEVSKTRRTRRRAVETTGNWHAERTAETRARLLEAAEKIFVRDGFEAAKLEEIAADAGHTRGAFYNIFDSKEDLFIALLAEEVEKRIARAREGAGSRARQALSKDELHRSMRKQYIRTLKDPTWNILFIEYKLFVLRHPELRGKVTKMQAKAHDTVARGLEEIFKGSGATPAVSPLAAGMALTGLANALGLDQAVSGALSEQEVDKILSIFFDALVGYRCPEV